MLLSALSLPGDGTKFIPLAVMVAAAFCPLTPAGSFRPEELRDTIQQAHLALDELRRAEEADPTDQPRQSE